MKNKYKFCAFALFQPIKETDEEIGDMVDGQALEKISLQMFDYPTWSMMNPGGNLYSFVRHYDLKAGRHTIHIDASDDPSNYYFDDIAITDDPAAFEPNRID